MVAVAAATRADAVAPETRAGDAASSGAARGEEGKKTRRPGGGEKENDGPVVFSVGARACARRHVPALAAAAARTLGDAGEVAAVRVAAARLVVALLAADEETLRTSVAAEIPRMRDACEAAARASDATLAGVARTICGAIGV